MTAHKAPDEKGSTVPQASSGNSHGNSDLVSDAKDAQNRLSQLWQLWTRQGDQETVQSPVTILGKKYACEEGDDGCSLKLLTAVSKRYWMSYRLGFEPIAKHKDGPLPLSFVQNMIFNTNVGNTFANIHSFVDNDNFTTDVGWGCMIRTSQSVLANAVDQAGYPVDVAMFADTTQAPFSLHKFVQTASDLPLRVRPGQWFGPSAASLSIQRLCHERNEHTSQPLHVVVCDSGDIYDNDITQFPLLLLLPLRLGIDHINAVYHDSLLQLLAVPHAAGIAGGKPSSSLYFFGFQDSSLLYLDPHYPQSVTAGTQSYHSNSYSKLAIDDMDPSMMVGLVISSLEDYRELKRLTANSKIVHFHTGRTSNEYVQVESEGFVDLGRPAFSETEPMSDSESSMVIVE